MLHSHNLHQFPLKKLKQLAHSLCDSFNSRNNDADGYWALGVLYQLAQQQRSTNVCLDLYQCQIIPESPELHPLLLCWFRKLEHTLQQFDIPSLLIKGAMIEVEFAVPLPQHSPANVAHLLDRFMQLPTSKACIIRCTLENVFGDVRVAERYSSCWPHNANRETRSIRRFTEGWLRE